MRAQYAPVALACLAFAAAISAAPSNPSHNEPQLKALDIAGITWTSSGRKGLRVELAVANLGPNTPDISARLVDAQGNVVRELPAQFASRRSSPTPRYEIVRVKVGGTPLLEGDYQLELELSDPVTGAHDQTNTPAAVSWKGELSSPPRQVLFQACGDGTRQCGNELSSGVFVHDGTDVYFAARPGSSANPVFQ